MGTVGAFGGVDASTRTGASAPRPLMHGLIDNDETDVARPMHLYEQSDGPATRQATAIPPYDARCQPHRAS
jgi:hypothetical protein